MADGDPLDDLFGDIPFEILESALRRGDLGAWDDALGEVVRRVSAAVRRRFPDIDLGNEAAQSALRTFLRRARAGEFHLHGPRDLVGLLVRIAHCKAARHCREARRQPGPLESEPTAPAPEAEPPEQEEFRKRLLREEMARQLRRMLRQVRGLLQEGFCRDILPYWFARTYEGQKVTREEIARAVGCSVPTVSRAFHEIGAKWQPLLQEGRQAVGELAARLRGAEVL
jgi:DNA-directed RNA polymerase specialized sigma24 family protein